MANVRFQVLPLTRLKRARRSILGRIEHAGTRFIVTDYGEAVAELGPLSKSAEVFLSQNDIAPEEGDASEAESESRPTGPMS